jgi:hypothetical protein
MQKISAWLMITVASMLIPATSRAYSSQWLVVEDLGTHICYRMTQMPEGNNWLRLGAFSTFRQAGMWTWEHRVTCKRSPVFN